MPTMTLKTRNGTLRYEHKSEEALAFLQQVIDVKEEPQNRGDLRFSYLAALVNAMVRSEEYAPQRGSSALTHNILRLREDRKPYARLHGQYENPAFAADLQLLLDLYAELWKAHRGNSRATDHWKIGENGYRFQRWDEIVDAVDAQLAGRSDEYAQLIGRAYRLWGELRESSISHHAHRWPLQRLCELLGRGY